MGSHPVTGRARFRIPGLIAAVALAALLLASIFLEHGDRKLLRGAGVASLAVALPFMFLPFHQLRRFGAAPGDRSYMEATRVATRGLYGLVRHPQYLGYCLLATGFALITQRWPATVLALLAVACLAVQMAAEEADLESQFGVEYRTYRRLVPRINLLLGLVRRVRHRG